MKKVISEKPIIRMYDSVNEKFWYWTGDEWTGKARAFKQAKRYRNRSEAQCVVDMLKWNPTGEVQIYYPCLKVV